VKRDTQSSGKRVRDLFLQFVILTSHVIDILTAGCLGGLPD
jgi:hypothetical protein